MAARLKFTGKKVTIHSPLDAVSLGLAYLSEDRKHFGLVTPMSVRDETITMASWPRFTSNRIWMKDGELKKIAQKYVDLLKVKTPFGRSGDPASVRWQPGKKL